MDLFFSLFFQEAQSENNKEKRTLKKIKKHELVVTRSPERPSSTGKTLRRISCAAVRIHLRAQPCGDGCQSVTWGHFLSYRATSSFVCLAIISLMTAPLMDMNSGGKSISTLLSAPYPPPPLHLFCHVTLRLREHTQGREKRLGGAHVVSPFTPEEQFWLVQGLLNCCITLCLNIWLIL